MIKGRLKSLLRNYLKALMIFSLVNESFNIGFDAVNIIKKPAARIETLAKRVRETQESLRIDPKTNPKIITSCHGNMLYNLIDLWHRSSSHNYGHLVKVITLTTLPAYITTSYINTGEYHPRTNTIFINGGYACLREDSEVVNTIAHEYGHAYTKEKIEEIKGKIKGEKFREGVAEHIPAQTLKQLGYTFKPSYEKEYKQVEELMKVKGYKNIEELIRGECKK